jgi:WXXGXW repeat (2 copies)
MKKVLVAGFAIATTIIIESCGPSEVTVGARLQQPYYVRPVSPGPDYVWIDGDWRVRHRNYYWTEGRWITPGTRIWISGSWESRNGGWYWRRGHWQ